MRRHRFSLHTRLLAVVMLCTVLLGGLAVVTVNIVVRKAVDSDARNLVRSKARAQACAIDAISPALPATSNAWVMADGEVLLAPATDADYSNLVRKAAETPGHPVVAGDPPIELWAEPIAGQAGGVAVAAVPLAPYQHTKRVVFEVSLVLAALLVTGVGLTAHLLLRAALAPIDRMTTAAADWSVSAPERRFVGTATGDELGRLATTLNSLLDRLQAGLRREQRLSGEIAHELRTPLTTIIGEAELALRHGDSLPAYEEAMGSVRDSARGMQETIDVLLAASQEPPRENGRCQVSELLAEAARQSAATAVRNDVEIAVAGIDLELAVAVDQRLALRLIQPIIDNACRFAATRVRLDAERLDGGPVQLTIDDDGPGVAQDDLERIFEPGVRGGSGAEQGSGAAGLGLGLALARRLAEALGGEVAARHDPAGGRFTVTLIPA